MQIKLAQAPRRAPAQRNPRLQPHLHEHDQGPLLRHLCDHVKQRLEGADQRVLLVLHQLQGGRGGCTSIAYCHGTAVRDDCRGPPASLPRCGKRCTAGLSRLLTCSSAAEQTKPHFSLCPGSVDPPAKGSSSATCTCRCREERPRSPAAVRAGRSNQAGKGQERVARCSTNALLLSGRCVPCAPH